MRALSVTFVVVAAALSSVPFEAQAGACLDCASHAECVAITANPNALCVLWAEDFGCGDQRRSCCPGQGCNLESGGVPSCELESRCARLVDGPQPDASVDTDAGPDSGAGDASGAQPAPDATPGLDAATSTRADASSIGRLGGGSAERSSSCNCDATSPSDGAPGAALVLLVAAGAVIAARRRR